MGVGYGHVGCRHAVPVYFSKRQPESDFVHFYQDRRCPESMGSAAVVVHFRFRFSDVGAGASQFVGDVSAATSRGCAGVA